MKNEAIQLFQCLDLTSLNAVDNTQTIERLVDFALDCEQKGLNVASICTFPNFTAFVHQKLKKSAIKTTAVAASFPHSQTFIEVKKLETQKALECGADEIDIVLNLGAFFSENYATLQEEIRTIKSIVQNRGLKVILETGELKTTQNIVLATELVIASGADFIKTSTGKSNIGATPEAVQAMCEVIAKHNIQTNKKVGIKISGGVRTSEQAKMYRDIVLDVLGEDWVGPDLFRIGASSLAQDLLEKITSK